LYALLIVLVPGNGLSRKVTASWWSAGRGRVTRRFGSSQSPEIWHTLRTSQK